MHIVPQLAIGGGGVRFFTGRTLLAANKVFHRYAVLQIVHECHILLQQRSVFKVFQLIDRLVEGVHGQGGVDPPQAGEENVLIQWGVVVSLYVWAINIAVAHVLE